MWGAVRLAAPFTSGSFDCSDSFPPTCSADTSPLGLRALMATVCVGLRMLLAINAPALPAHVEVVSKRRGAWQLLRAAGASDAICALHRNVGNWRVAC